LARCALRRLPAPGRHDPGIALTRLPPRPLVLPEDIAGLDALVLLAEDFSASSIAPDGRLSLTRFMRAG
jgi:hypothetical protein